MENRQSILVRYMVITIPIVVLVIALLGAGAFWIFRESIFEINRDLGRAILENDIIAIDLWLEEEVRTAQVLGDDPAIQALIRNAEDEEALRAADRALGALVRNYPYFEYVGVFGPDGNVLVETGDSAYASSSEGMSLVAAAESDGETAIGDTYLGILDQPVMPVAAPIRGDGGSVGAVVIASRLSQLTDRFIDQEALGETAYLFIIDERGEVLAHPNADLVLTEEGRDATRPWFVSAQNGIAEFTRDFQGSVNLYLMRSYAPGDDQEATGWYVYYRKGLDEILAQARRLLYAIAGGIVLVSLILAFVLYRASAATVTRPLSRLENQLDAIASGGGDLTVALEIQRRDEIGAIGSTFNRFLETLRGIVSRIKTTVGLNLEIRDNLTSSTTQTSAAVNEIISNIASIESIMGKLGGEVNNAAASTEEIQRNIDLLSGQASSQSSAVAESTASVEQMIASLRNVAAITEKRSSVAENLVHGVEEGGRLLGETGQTIEEVTRNVDSILAMTSTIAEIANQTNLLAMNAAIEAAHAGEAGRGFAVVAEEIRKLAESAGASSKDIATNVRTIVDQIHLSGDNTGRLQTQLTEIISEVREMADAFREIRHTTSEISAGSDQILKAMSLLNDISAQLAGAADEMKTGAEQTSDNMVNVSELTGTARAAVEEITTGSNEILSAMTNLQDLTTRLSDRTVELQTEVDRFVV